jgi:hypothetical protein
MAEPNCEYYSGHSIIGRCVDECEQTKSRQVPDRNFGLRPSILFASKQLRGVAAAAPFSSLQGDPQTSKVQLATR